MSNKEKLARIDRRYRRIRGDKKFRLAPDERSSGPDDKNEFARMRDQFDNNPGRTLPTRNPDDL